MQFISEFSERNPWYPLFLTLEYQSKERKNRTCTTSPCEGEILWLHNNCCSLASNQEAVVQKERLSHDYMTNLTCEVSWTPWFMDSFVGVPSEMFVPSLIAFFSFFLFDVSIQVSIQDNIHHRFLYFSLSLFLVVFSLLWVLYLHDSFTFTQHECIRLAFRFPFLIQLSWLIFSLYLSQVKCENKGRKQMRVSRERHWDGKTGSKENFWWREKGRLNFSLFFASL